MTQTPLQSPLVDFNVVDTNFEKWAKPGQFSRLNEKYDIKIVLGTRKFFILKEVK